MNGNIDVSIIIVSFNNKSLLDQCLKSIKDKTTEVNYEIIVVDNCSIDGSREFLVDVYPDVRLISTDANCGFGKACNLGAQYALGVFLFFLNPDTIFLNNALKYFLDFYKATNGQQIGILGSLLLSPTLYPTNSYGAFPTYSNILMSRWRKIFKEKKRQGYQMLDSPFKVEFVTGADMFILRDVFNDAKGFDRRYFMYYEETDLQKTLVDFGYTNYIIPGPKIVHLEGGGVKPSMNSRIRSENSMYMYLAKHNRNRIKLILFYFAYSFSSLFSIPLYSIKDNRRYYQNVFNKIPRLIAASF